MKQPEVRVAEVNATKDIATRAIDTMNTILKSPGVALVGTFALVELLQRYPKDNPILSDKLGNLLEAGTVLIPLIESLGKTAQGALPSLLPLLVK